MNEELSALLKASLARRSPPPGFASRVAARLPAERPRRWRAWAAAALAASLFAGVAGARYHNYREGLRAKEQLMVALGITADKLAFAQHKVDEWSQRSAE